MTRRHGRPPQREGTLLYAFSALETPCYMAIERDGIVTQERVLRYERTEYANGNIVHVLEIE